MPDVTDMVAGNAVSLRRRYLLRFEQDTFRQRPLRIRPLRRGHHDSARPVPAVS